MKLPRDVSVASLPVSRRQPGYEAVRRRVSHVLTTPVKIRSTPVACVRCLPHENPNQ